MLTPRRQLCPSPRLGQVWGWSGGAGMTWGTSWVSSYGTVLSLNAAGGGQGGRWGRSNLPWRPRPPLVGGAWSGCGVRSWDPLALRLRGAEGC